MLIPLLICEALGMSMVTAQKNGDPSLPLSERLYPVDFKEFSFREFDRIFPQAVSLYLKGWSLRDIARECGCSKNKVLSDLRKAGVQLREKVAQATPRRKIDGDKQGALPYYGFCYFEGRIIPDPREFPTLKLIHRLWKRRKTIHQITLELNRSKVPSRQGRQWSWAAVQNIVRRFEGKSVILHPGGRFEFK